MFELLLQEIMSSNLMVHPASLNSLEILIQKIKNAEISDKIQLHSKIPSINVFKTIPSAAIISVGQEYEENPFDSFEDNSIAVIPVIGHMFKYGSWWNYGMDDIANLIRLADQSSKIIGTVLLCNTPGGTSLSVIQLEDALRNRTKPCVGLVDGQCCSGGIYALSFCDQIVATNKMCIIGNIGVYIQIVNYDKLYEDWGIKFISVYPPESKFKNLAYQEAKQGNTEMLIQEQLSPFAIHFQNIIKENRKNIDLSVEGILEGKDFYANDALNNGLIDSITNYEGAIELVKKLYSEKQSIYSQFKK